MHGCDHFPYADLYYVTCRYKQDPFTLQKMIESRYIINYAMSPFASSVDEQVESRAEQSDLMTLCLQYTDLVISPKIFDELQSDPWTECLFVSVMC